VNATDTSADIGLERLAMIAPGEGWAVGVTGGDASGAPASSTLYHFNGRAWQPVSLPFRAALTSIVMLSPSEGWAVGYRVSADNVGGGAVILRFHDGAWSSFQQ
jgi:photosystem II stability/assembly factor-like uncharacterized protein